MNHIERSRRSPHTENKINMNGRSVARLVLALVIIAGVAFLGVGAYNAGVTQGLAQSGQVVVTPGAYPVGPYIGGYGYGFGHGFGFFGFLGGLLFLFLFIGLLRAAFGGHRRHWGGGPGAWGGPGRWGGPGDPRFRDHWESRVREVHDELHRSADRPTGGETRPGTQSGPDGEPPA
jgi:hypothetical protein